MTLPLRVIHPELADALLVERARQGDSAALGTLFHRYAPELGRLAGRLTSSRADAEDVVQDLFVGLPEALAGYREDGRLLGWLRRVTINLALKRLRTERRRREDDLGIIELPGAAAQSADALLVRRAVDALPESLRTIVVLKVLEGYSHSEIAELLGISRGASEVRLTRAMARLRQDLGEPS